MVIGDSTELAGWKVRERRGTRCGSFTPLLPGHPQFVLVLYFTMGCLYNWTVVLMDWNGFTNEVSRRRIAFSCMEAK
jgi:hypothetical protein